MNILVVNSKAGDARDESFWREALSRAGIPIDAVECDEPQTIDVTAQDCLIVAGGDGTLRVQSRRCRRTSCILGVLPAGTGNDFARGLGIPLEPDEACRNLAEGKMITVDTGLVNDELFLNVAHVGLGANISRDTASDTKHSWGRFAYVRTLLEHLRLKRGFRAEITSDGSVIRGRWLQITVANGTSFGGGQPFFEASARDGQLDLLAIRPHPPLKLFLVWLLARISQSAPEGPAILRRRSPVFEIRAKHPMAVTADGDILTELPARFTVDPGALRVMAPRQQPPGPNRCDGAQT